MAALSDNHLDSDMGGFQPVMKNPIKSVLPSERFKAPTSNEDMAKICKGFIFHPTRKRILLGHCACFLNGDLKKQEGSIDIAVS